jgi:hypothetical protein
MISLYIESHLIFLCGGIVMIVSIRAIFCLIMWERFGGALLLLSIRTRYTRLNKLEGR